MPCADPDSGEDASVPEPNDFVSGDDGDECGGSSGSDSEISSLKEPVVPSNVEEEVPANVCQERAAPAEAAERKGGDGGDRRSAHKLCSCLCL